MISGIGFFGLTILHIAMNNYMNFILSAKIVGRISVRNCLANYKNKAKKMEKKKQQIVPTKLDVFSMQFDVDTPRFLKEVIENSDCRMYGACWNIFRSLLVQVAQRATELNDPIMDVLMIRLNLYEVPVEERHKIIEQIKKEIEDGKLKINLTHQEND